MEFKEFLLNEENGVATLTINRPDSLNSLNPDCWHDIGRFADYVNETDSIKYAVITGKGDKAFIAGSDINFLKVRDVSSILNDTYQDPLNKLENCRKPTIAAVNGFAFGGGFEVAMACDFRIGTDNAVFGLPELGLGILPGAGGTQRLAKLVGMGWAREIILAGRRIKADEAFRLGIITRLTTQDKLKEETEKLISMIATRAPVSYQLTKRLITQSLSTDQGAGMLLEQFAYGVLISTADKKEGVNAFLEKRPAKFEGK